jgi:hypothetical protein
MRRPTASENMTVFVLFFGISMMEAFASRRWLSAAFWLGMALMFLGMSLAGRRSARRDARPGQSMP